MVSIMVWIVTVLALLLSFVAAYISFSYAEMRKDTAAADGENKEPNIKNEKKGIRFILSKLNTDSKQLLSIAVSQFKTFNIIQWGAAVLSALSAAAAVYGVMTADVNSIYQSKIIITSIILSSAFIVDFKTKKIPNLTVNLLILIKIIYLPFEYAFQRDDFKILIISSLIGLVAVFFVLLIISKLTKGGFGMGDVKLLSALGFMTGITAVLFTILFGMIICMFFGIALILLKKKDKKDTIPFGPFILLGFACAMILGIF